MFNTSSPGRYDAEIPLFLGHKAPVLDFAFNNFSDHIVASASEDCTVRLWKIPEGGLTETISTPLITMQGHRKKVHGLAFHPTVRTLLASISADGTAKLWDAEKSKEIHSVLPSGQGFYDLIFDPFGTTYMASMKDKSLQVIDARSGSIAADIQNVHDGNKCIKLAAMGDDANRLITVGANKTSVRQCKIWDPRHTNSEVCKIEIDNGAGALTPIYDPDTGLLMLAAKGETSIRCYEIPFNGTEIFHITDAKSSQTTKGVVLLPKRNLDVMSCEVNRLLKLTPNSVEPVSFFVPRKALAFQDDLYPDVYASTPPHTLDAWTKGSDLLPKKVPLSSLVNTTVSSRSQNSSPVR